MRKLQIILLLSISLGFTDLACAQDEHIYLVKMFDCTHKPTERSQTGFRVRGVKGLVTALHGVADCRRITASNKKGLLLDQPLVIRKMDSDRDAALVSSTQLDGAVDGGFEVAGNVSWESLRTVKVYGHPYGISSLETTLTLRNPPLKPLKDLVPAAPLSTLKERRSPNHLINVLSLQGNLLPGHSGAPVVDSSGRIVAVANGGLREGFAGISWAVPYKDIEWDGVGNKLTAMAQLNPNVLFASDALPVRQLDEVKDDTCGQLSKLVTAAQAELISIVGEPLGETSFKSTILLPGVSYGYVYPKQYVGFYLFSSDNVQKVASRYYSWVSNVSSCFPDWERKELDSGIEPKSLRSLFRKKAKSPVIEVSYNLVLDKGRGHNSYTLRLHVYTAPYGWW